MPPFIRLRHPSLAVAAVLFAGGSLLAGCGSDGADSATGTDGRTIQIEMRDIAFAPATVEVAAGETVTFVFENTGEVAHDAYLGDDAAQADHEAEMAGGGRDTGEMGDMGDMHHGGDDEDAITVEPGGTGELTHTFAEGETVVIGCHQPGHYDAGMMVEVSVT